MVDVPHQVRGILILFVIVSIPTSIITEFFVNPTNDFFSAFETGLHG